MITQIPIGVILALVAAGVGIGEAVGFLITASLMSNDLNRLMAQRDNYLRLYMESRSYKEAGE